MKLTDDLGTDGMRIRSIATSALALVLLAGCSSSGEEPAAAPPPSPAPTTPTVRPPLTVPQYQALLAGIEQRIRPLLVQAMATKTLPATDTARVRLAIALEREYKAAEPVTAPRGLSSEHHSLLAVLGSYRNLRTLFSTAMLEKKNGCGLPKPVASLLYEAKRDVYYSVGGSSLKALTEDLAKVKISFGKTMMPAGPADPPRRDRRGVNGKVLQRSGPRGSGVLQITNDDDSDVVIAAVAGDPKRPLASIYVRGDSKATLSGIRGTYSVYVKSGSDWDSRRGLLQRKLLVRTVSAVVRPALELADQPGQDRARERDDE
ncbi:hypothetical protein FB561_1936 [Kribbella amoyensis]|uniref:Uncharacterized protein n=1 Tax=Kribbella amoyensis TaxID=996641 RepID=A0A561BPP9_9ACTN|nr:hypothetical protein [Kribbella amoyensis]TWD80841.1 hypothetical protein FB561_1936 [Kribbella amoyensis]